MISGFQRPPILSSVKVTGHPAWMARLFSWYLLWGSLGNITKPLAQRLIEAKQQVTVISSKAARAAEIEALGATAAIGDLNDTDFLTKTFTGADAVYTMVPPGESENRKQQMRKEGDSLVAAVKAAGIKKVVNLSSIEQAFNALDGVDVKHLRPGFFYVNLFNNIGMIKHGGIYGDNYGANAEVVMVHPADIAAAAAEELLSLSFTGKSFRYVIDDIRAAKDVATAFKGMMQAGMGEDLALNFVEMGQAVRSGEMFADFNQHTVQQGKIKLEDFAKEFAAAYAKG
ncbi:NmrA family protein [Russula earlei]|uniref:NmrA family protein n=1 Tax=Russula earlei TaxID=71964 RepID=A0ACC0TUC1_9AGAM|nr:NmrA family protein [Russula earlei]